MHTPSPYLPRFHVLMPCAGSGSRAGGALPKQYRTVAGQPLALHTAQALAQVAGLVSAWVVRSPQGDAAGVAPVDWPAPFGVLDCGGDSRAQTVLNGLRALRLRGVPERDWVLVHDAARCLVQPQAVAALVSACAGQGADAKGQGGLLALPVPDTLKHAAPQSAATPDSGKRPLPQVGHTLSRAGVWLAQTPQMFRLGDLLHALEDAALVGFAGITDEASAMERMGHSPLLVMGEATNIKVTYPEDFALAEAVLAMRGGRTAHAITAPGAHVGTPPEPPQMQPIKENPMDLRIGEGWDVHALVPGRRLVLGGVQVPHTLGLQGHSDADVLLHAITDALLGAAGLGDIGRHFPDTDAQFAGADSAQLLAKALGRVQALGWAVVNVDSTIVAQAPKLAPHMPAIAASVARVLGLALEQVNVKAKTAEKLGPVGLEQSMEARAVVLLSRAGRKPL